MLKENNIYDNNVKRLLFKVKILLKIVKKLKDFQKDLSKKLKMLKKFQN